MIKDVMLVLDGGEGDEVRLEAARTLSCAFDAHVIGLFFNSIPTFAYADPMGSAAIATLSEEVRVRGDSVAADLSARLEQARPGAELRRLDLPGEAMGGAAARAARGADAFIALRPTLPLESAGIVNSVLFGAGRHILLYPDALSARGDFNRVMIAWNGTRACARAIAESMPYLQRARNIVVCTVVDNVIPEDFDVGAAVAHLRRHAIEPDPRRLTRGAGGVGETLLNEAERGRADLIVMGGYSHSRLQELLLGGVTRKLMHDATITLLMAH